MLQFAQDGASYNLVNPSFRFDSSQPYIPMTGCVLDHILTSNNLLQLEKIFYLSADSLSYINSQKGKGRSIALSAKSWAKRLSCSKSKVFTLQKSLEDKGYFIISRDTDITGHNQRNIITTTIPDNIFEDLRYSTNRFDLDEEHSISSTYISTSEGKRQYLDRTKLFIRINYSFLKSVTACNDISAASKVSMLYFYLSCYKNNISKGSTVDPGWSFNTTYHELQHKLGYNKFMLSRIMNELELSGLVSRTRSFVGSIDHETNRTDKSLWNITLNIGFPTVVKAKEPDVRLVVAGCDPAVADSGQYNNKVFIINNSIIKDIDNIDVKCLKIEHSEMPNLLENEQSSFLSKSLKNKVEKKEVLIKNNTENPKICIKNPEYINKSSLKLHLRHLSQKEKNIKELKKGKELRQYYPLSEDEVSKLNSKAEREFSANFINQLLLKLYIKYPEKKFLSRHHMLSYMSKVVANELHQAPKVNHETFKFTINMNNQEERQQTTYLNKIESSLYTDKLTRLKKKIAGVFEQDKAYRILTESRFVSSYNNDFVAIKVPESIGLTEMQHRVLERQVTSVYGEGNNAIEYIQPECPTTKDEAALIEQQSVLKLEIRKKEVQRYIASIDTSTIWGKIRKGLIDYFNQDGKDGIALDKSWFSKLAAETDEMDKKLLLKAPGNFIRDYVQQKYGSLIEGYGKQQACQSISYTTICKIH